jgi:hypothetical protein
MSASKSRIIPSNDSRATLVAFGWGGGEGGNIRALYKAACLTASPRWRLYRAARREGLSRKQLLEWLKIWILGRTCRGCDAVIEAGAFAVWNTYWTAMWAPCHAGCREEGMRAEAFECQCIDADCNDCRHFQRGVVTNPEMVPNPQIFMPIQKADVVKPVPGTPVYPADVMKRMSIAGVRGNCLKFSRTVIANPKRASCNPCFEHRRSPVVATTTLGLAL